MTTGWRTGDPDMGFRLPELPTGFEELLASWCRDHLGSPSEAVLFRSGHLSLVTGLRLADGRRVVVKARPAAARLAACVEVQRQLWEAGFPCPQPLAGPSALGDLAATAEAFVPGGRLLPSSVDAPHLSATALARLLDLAPPAASVPSLDPPPPWVRWAHDLPGVWPPHDESGIDLNSYPEPGWLTEVAARARARLLACGLPPVVGHADWTADNLRWRGVRTKRSTEPRGAVGKARLTGRSGTGGSQAGRQEERSPGMRASAYELYVVHDWDSVVALPEPALAGAASGIFLAAGGLAMSDLRQADAFLNAYEGARGKPWTAEEREVCWAAALWVNAFDAKKQSVDGGVSVLHRLAAEAPERLRLAGA